MLIILTLHHIHIPLLLLLYKVIPNDDLKTLHNALFCGYFGPVSAFYLNWYKPCSLLIRRFFLHFLDGGRRRFCFYDGPEPPRSAEWPTGKPRRCTCHCSPAHHRLCCTQFYTHAYVVQPISNTPITFVRDFNTFSHTDCRFLFSLLAAAPWPPLAR